MILTRCLKLLFLRIRKRSTALKRIYRTKRILVYILMMVVILTVLSWYLPSDKKKKEQTMVDFGYSNYDEMQDDLLKGFIEDKDKGCALPLLDPFDKEAVKFEKTSPNGWGLCKGQDLVECYLDECFIRHQYRDKLQDWSCIYHDILYYGNQKLGPKKKLSVHQKYKLVKSDLVDVTCFGPTPLRPGSSPYWSGHKAGLRKVASSYRRTHSRRLSTMILAFKSMSKNGFMRKMPKTHDALKQMGAYIFNGYNVVGDGTIGSFFPVLVGESAMEYFEHTTGSDVQDMLLFSQVSKLGYRTAHFEDSPFLGVFQQKFNFFRHQLTDHYLLPLLDEVFQDNTEENKSFCLGDTPLYRMLLNLTDQFLQLDGNHFSFTFIGDITHNSFNMASAADEDLASFLQNIQQDRKMKETVLFVMSDHGHSSPAFRETTQGKLEERLPLMAMVIPDRLMQTKPGVAAALQANVDLLVTPYDVHTTLTDILGIKDHRNKYTVPGADLERGLTLLQPIPSSRSCGEAGVQPLWCVCAHWFPLSQDDPMSKEISEMLVDYINKLISEWSDICQKRTLVSIDYVMSQLPKERVKEYEAQMQHDHRTFSNYYQAKIIVGPGRAVFEGSIRHVMKSNHFIFADAELSRIDPYANSKESECIRKNFAFLNKFCYCVNYTEPNDGDTNKSRKT